MDLIIRNGRVFDGSGNPWFRTDIRVEDGKITEIGNLRGSRSDKTIDASRLIVCPGFIDIHSHSDIQLIINPTMDSKIYQGVTTELNGNCGHSPCPLIGLDVKRLRYYSIMEKLKVKPWSTTREYLDTLKTRCHATNTATLMGYVNIRVPVLGMESNEPDDKELSLMKSLVAQGMEDGLFGLSTGLFYPPNSFATTDELTELCRVVAEFDGVYVTHIRGAGKTLVEAIEEAIKIGEESGVRVQCVHHKAYGKNYSYKIPITLNLIEEARVRGVDVSIDVYPYIRDSGNFTGWLPSWAHAGGSDELLKRLKDKKIRDRIKREIYNKIEDPGTLISTSILTSLQRRPELSGKKIAELAEERDVETIDYAIELLIEEEGLGVGISSEFGFEKDLKMILQNPNSMIGSDGSGVSVNVKEWTHPRNYGTYARLLGRYVRDKGTLTLQEAIRKCTSFPAQRLGLKERGLIREGMWADITIFDYEKIRDNYSLTNPAQYAEGVEYVLVNGTIVLNKGKHTGKLPGKTLLLGKS